jgi:hypothetical protein
VAHFCGFLVKDPLLAIKTNSHLQIPQNALATQSLDHIAGDHTNHETKKSVAYEADNFTIFDFEVNETMSQKWAMMACLFVSLANYSP